MSRVKSFRYLVNLIVLLVLLSSSNVSAQITDTKTLFGVQVKPIIPNRFIGQYIQEYDRPGDFTFRGDFRQRLGYSAGIAIRHKFSGVFSFETAVNFIRRNYDFTYSVPDSNLNASSSVGFIGYDIPINGLVYVRIGENWYMNASGGLNFGFFPTSVESFSKDATVLNKFSQIMSPRRRVQIGLNINYGFEYRMKDVGTFYLGASYLLPLNDIATTQISWLRNGTEFFVREDVNGSFLTLDFKYFFPK